MHRRNVVLPEPEGPRRQTTSPRVDVHVDALEHLVAVEGLGDVDRVDERLAGPVTVVALAVVAVIRLLRLRP